ncbi:MAG: carbohydrate ABC transporter permease [Treponema sp.]|jgi:ABC-type glycerol-3-phosphate transport system permease component|nr:carbohydrate ABC transporter permease [Treponema sp.]
MGRIKPAAWYLPRLVTWLVLMFFVFVAVMPLLWMWFAALRTADPANPDPFAMPKGFTFDNIIKAWSSGKMSIYMVNSILVAIPRVFIVLILASLAGFAFGKLRWKYRDLIFTAVLVGMMIPIQAMLIPVYYNLNRFGLVNTRFALILPYFGMAMPFSCFMMRAFYRDLPGELADSASMDGCGKFRTWFHIMAPLTKPALISLLIFEFMWSWNDYLLPVIMIYSDRLRTMPLGLNYFRGEHTSDQTLIAAGVTICTLPIIVVYMIFQRSFIAGITAGAVKG